MYFNTKTGKVIYAIFVSVISLTVCYGQNTTNANAEKEVVEWLKANAIPIKSPAFDSSEDLSFLVPVIADKNLVLLGEGTHGTREFFLMKDKIVRYLIEKRNFKNLGMEYDMVNSLPVQEYIQTGRGNAESALSQQRGWVWNTEEVLSTVEWIKKYNEKNDKKVNYFGVDMLIIVPPLTYSLDFLKSQQIAETAEVETKLKELTGRSIYDFQTNGNDFYEKFSGDAPIENNYKLKEITLLLVNLFDANKEKIVKQTSLETWETNKRVAFTAYQKSKHLLQWNMNSIFPTFGRKQQSEIYGKAENLSKNLKRFYQENDPAQYKEIEPVLMLIENPSRGNRKYRELTIEERGKLKDAIMSSIERLDVRRSLYLKKADANKLAEVEADLRLILKIFEIYKDYLSKPALSTNEREIGLAENVEWLYEKGKTIIWAHNGHVSKSGNSETDTMGTLLKNKYKDEMLVIGTTFNKGKFQAAYSEKQTNANTSQLKEFEVGQAKEGSLEYLMAQVGEPIFLIDFRKLPEKGAVREWFSQKHYVRSIGNSFNPDKPDDYYEFIEIPKHYDIMIFFNETTRAKPTKSVIEKYKAQLN